MKEVAGYFFMYALAGCLAVATIWFAKPRNSFRDTYCQFVLMSALVCSVIAFTLLSLAR